MEKSREESLDRLFELLPVIYRQRDAEQGYPLRALLQVIAEQVNVVEADIAQLYENWFIETCEDWVVPYLADLIGYRLVHEAGEPGEVTTLQGRLRNKILIPRREVANTINFRRRKGTLALLEILAQQVAGWPARAVEFYRLLGQTQGVNHLRLERGQTADLRLGDALEHLDGPFDELAHTVDVRRINSLWTRGRSNIPSVGLFVWRLKVYPVTRTPAYYIQEAGVNSFTFSVLSNDAPLFTKPEREAEPTDIAGEINLPTPIRRRPFEKNKTAYYSYDKSLQIWVGDPKDGTRRPLPVDKIIVADLDGWQYRPESGYAAVDPVLGRIAFSTRDPLPKSGVWVSYHYGFSADIGGGEYRRILSQPAQTVIYRVVERPRAGKREFDRIGKALDQWQQDGPDHAVIEIDTSGVYVEQINIKFTKKDQSLQLRAGNKRRPVIRLLDWQTDRPDSLYVQGEGSNSFTLDGLLVASRGMQVEGDLAELTIRHSTLVPGWSILPNCDPRRPTESSLDLINTQARVTIQDSIIGTIQVNQDEVKTDPISIYLSDTILDATSPIEEAVGAPTWPMAHAVLTFVRCTVFGQIETHAIELAENSIFMGLIKVARRQWGCMRFCYVTPGSRTPRRYNCQPDLVEQPLSAEFERWKMGQTGAALKAIEAEKGRALDAARLRMEPQFESQRYGAPTYARLTDTSPEEIRRGADDESEMGVFHNLYQPQRAANLQARLDEYMPAGMDTGIIYAS